MSALVAIEAVALALLGLLVAGLLQSHAEILRALRGLGAGRGPGADGPATIRDRPDPVMPRSTQTGTFDLLGTTPGGDSMAFGVVGAAENTLLAFLSSGCLTCAGFWEAFSDGKRLSVPGKARLVVVTKGPDKESPSRVAELASPSVPVVMSSEAWEAYRVPVAPYFIYIDGASQRIVGEGAAGTWDHVAELMGQALADVGLAEHRTHGRGRLAASGDSPSRVDADLLSAGIHPGHPSLYQSPQGPDAPEAHAGDA